MIEIVNTQPEALEYWMKCCGDLRSSKKGLLWKFNHSVPITQMSESKLIKRMKDYDRIIRENCALKQENASLLEIHASETRSANEMMLEVMKLREELSAFKSKASRVAKHIHDTPVVSA